jgi:hypothetical protein
MQHAEIDVNGRKKLIALEPTGWGKSFQELFDQTDVSGYEVWLAESQNNFENPFAKASEELYMKKGFSWCEIFHDVVKRGERGTNDKGKKHIIYISHANTEQEKTHESWTPGYGYFVPTSDGIFYPGTLIPFHALEKRDEAIKIWEKFGMPTHYVSHMNAILGAGVPDDDANNLVMRYHSSDWRKGGMFYVFMGGQFSYPTHGKEVSRPTYKTEK